MKIASWNVNSLNVRLPHLQEWLRMRAPDVVALQETKLEDAKFPEMPLLEQGYRSVFSGQKTYNGVAILSRSPIADVQVGIPGFEDEQRRAIAATVDGVRIVNLYVVNGQTVGCDKYDYKLRWIEAVHGWLSDEARRYPELVVLGDFNIAPEDRDVHDPARWNEDSILTSTAERAALKRLLGLGPARQLPPAQRRRRPLQLVGLPRRRPAPQPRPAHRPGAGERGPEAALRRRPHRPRAAPVGPPQRPRARVRRTHRPHLRWAAWTG
jgi:exodeoxyribonuclease-3